MTHDETPLIVGMDFGTTNSGMAFWSAEADAVEILPLDPANRNRTVARTAVYITNDQEVYIGRDAVETYMAQNTGRPVRMEKVWVGEIDVYAEDMHYVADVYVFADVLSPGRLFLSLKSGLREADFLGTVVGQFYYPLEDLIALYLTVSKTRVEQQLGREVKEIVLGRPVRFAFDPEKDKLAQNRLLDAAFRAGYETVRFQYEPIAAAYAYAQTIEAAENILIFDFGGGTLDITIMRLHAHGRGRHEILATGGIPVAGDIFDQKLTRAKLPRHFGEGSHYASGRHTMPVPSWIYDIFSDWQKILELQTPEHKETLEDILRTAHRPREIEGLISLVSNNYGLQMFDQVEQAKRRLSEDMGTLIGFSGPKFHVRQMVTRTEFEGIIRPEVQAVAAHLDQMLAEAGLTAAEIDNVVRTGGSAEIPAFKRLLEAQFGREKIRAVDAFSSVTAGLGVIAHQISLGELELPVYTAADLRHHSVEKESQVQSANLRLLQKRIALREGVAESAATPDALRVILGNGNRIALVPTDQQEVALDLGKTTWGQALTAGYDAPLLMITNFYRFLLVTPRQLEELADLQMTLGALHHFREYEEITVMAEWEPLPAYEHMTLVTSRGFVRAYKMEKLKEKIENPAPYQFDHQLDGVPIAVLGINKKGMEIVIANDQGRCLRLPTSERRLYLRGLQAIYWKEGERVMSAHALAADSTAELLLITAEGYGKRLDRTDLPVATEGKTRPSVVATRKPTQMVVPYQERSCLVTTNRLLPLSVAKLPPPDQTSKTYRLTKPQGEGEKLVALLSD